MKKIKPYLNFLTFILIFNLGIFTAHAATTADKYTVLAPLPCIESAPTTYIDSSGQTQTNPGITCSGGNGAVQTQVDFKTYVQYTMNLLIALSAVVAVVMLVWGGVEYMFTSSFSNKKEGLERAKNAVIGLLLVLTSYIILRTVDPRLVEIPNTLVPQLNVAKWLTMDANQILMNKLEKQLNEYELNRKALGDLLQKTKEEKLAKQMELENINKQMGALDQGNSDDKAKYQALEVEKSRLEDDLRQIDINYQTTLGRTVINGVLVSSTDAALKASNLSDGALAIKQLIKDEENINVNLADALTRLRKLGDPQATTVRETAKFAKTAIALTKVEVSMNSAELKSVSLFPGSSKLVFLINTDGTNNPAASAPEAKKYLQSELDKIQNSLKTISDENMKNDLQIKIDDAQDKLNSLDKFNKK